MEFEVYVAARWTVLVRSVVLLGVAEGRAPGLVARTLEAQAPTIRRSADPDPEVVAALLRARDLHPDPVGPTPYGGLTDDDVRRALAGLPRDVRDAAVLLFHVGLPVRDAASALRLSPSETLTLGSRARDALGVTRDLDPWDVLHGAGEAIDPPPPPTLVPAPSRRWPAAVATVAIGAVVAAAVLTIDDPRDDTLADDEVPSLFGYDVDDARELLEHRGLEVKEDLAKTCDPVGLVVGVLPPIGTRFEEGDTVTVFVAAPGGSGCEVRYLHRSAVWEFVDFATGRGPAPAFATEVNVVVDGGEPAQLTAEDAADPARWGTLLQQVDAATRTLGRSASGRWLTPQLNVSSEVPPRSTCGVRRPVEAGRRTALRAAFQEPGQLDHPCPLVLDLYRTDGLIDAAVLYTRRAPDV